MVWVIGGALAFALVYATLELVVDVSGLRETVYGTLPFVVSLAVFVCAVAIGAAVERQKEIDRLKGKKK